MCDIATQCDAISKNEVQTGQLGHKPYALTKTACRYDVGRLRNRGKKKKIIIGKQSKTIGRPTSSLGALIIRISTKTIGRPTSSFGALIIRIQAKTIGRPTSSFGALITRAYFAAKQKSGRRSTVITLICNLDQTNIEITFISHLYVKVTLPQL